MAEAEIVQGYAPNQPRSVYRGSRFDELPPLPAEIARGWVRLRSKCVARVIVRGVAHGRLHFWSWYVRDRNVLVLVGTVYVAPVGTPGPTSATSVLDPAFEDMGYLSDVGVTMTNEIDVQPKSSWTGLYPKDFSVVGRRVAVGFTLREYNKRAVELALEGTAVTSGAQWKHGAYNDAAVSKALVIDTTDVDGITKLRIYFPSGIVTADVSSRMARTTAADLPVVFGAPQTAAPPYTMFRSGGK